MSLRWRASGDLLCAAQHDPEEDDTYIDDRLHDKLASELKVITPKVPGVMTGIWYWKEKS